MQQNKPTLRDKIAQKLMIDMRYYCDDVTVKTCRTPVTELPPELADVITDNNLGGIILFADNLEQPEQIVKLNYDLQQAAKRSSLGIPLFLAIDQEGGRVFRSPRDKTVAFTGNMALGATYADHGTAYAEQSAKVIADELKVLGFNVNHAPTIDVNSNPLNPVINVRSYGEQPQMVAQMGHAQIKGFQDNGIIGTLKHFPGHGDTSVDSHVGLPRVDHDLETIHRLDVGPYKAIFGELDPGMVMISHLQYPELDDSTFTTKDGDNIIYPATMSRKIITDFLRGELGYQGVVITDALDMAGITHFYNKPEAILATFQAGVDIAEMGLKIRNPNDLQNVSKMIDYVVAAIENGEYSEQELDASFARIQKLKQDYKLAEEFDYNLEQRLALTKTSLGLDASRQLEQDIALASITQVTGEQADVVIGATESVHIIMPDTAKCVALQSALTSQLPNLNTTCTSAVSFDADEAQQQIAAADVVIAANIAPRQSAAEMGGMDDLETNKARSLEVADVDVIYDLLAGAKQAQKRTLFVSLRTPYEIERFAPISDATLATYAYNTYQDPQSEAVRSPALEALAQVLAGKAVAKGKLPVTVEGV